MNEHYDIIVAGGGFSGACAAIAASRSGKRVLLIEKYNCLGGVAVNNLVMPFMPNHTKNPETGERMELSGGLYLEILKELDKISPHPAPWRECFSEEYLKLVLNRMAIQSGVTLLYQSTVTQVKMSGEWLKSVSVHNVSGNTEYSAQCFIDATGDANICHMAGYEYHLGRESDKKCQPMTLSFRVGNVDMDRFDREQPKINTLWKKMQAEGKIRNPRDNLLIFKTADIGVLHFNSTRVIGLDPTDASELTRAEIEAREQVFEIFDFLRSNLSAFEKSVLLSTGMQIGVRESRRVVGEYTLTRDDIINCAKPYDGVALCNYDMDIHSPDGGGTDHYYLKEGQYYSIPYRCLVPRGSKNLLVTGRCISATHEAQSSLRIMPVCASLGQASGVAASLFCKKPVGVAEINIDSLKSALREQGAILEY